MISKNTLGTAKCQIILSDILLKEDNPKLTSIVTARLHRFREGAAEIVTLNHFAKHLLVLWYNDNLKGLEDRSDVSDECKKFWKNCLKVDFRRAQEKINERKNRQRGMVSCL